MKGLDEYGNITEGIGTSYATPRVVQKFAAIYDGLNEKDLLLAKAMLIHSARMHTQELFKNKDLQYDYNYYGYGIPPIEAEDILQCSEDEVTLIFKQKIKQNSHLEMLDFPYPDSLIKDGKYYGEVYMTLVYYPVLDERYGKEYCRNELNASFGTYTHDGKTKYKGEIPLDKTWDECYMPSEINNGCKWNPIKTYHREFKKGIEVKDGWKLRVDMTSRNGIEVAEQEFVLIITIKSHNKSDIYTEVVNKFKNLGYIVNNLETKLQIRQRQ